jgi:hypothetical protein
VGAGLVFGRVSYGLGARLLEEREDAGRGIVVGLVEESNNVLRAVLSNSVSCALSRNEVSPHLSKDSLEHGCWRLMVKGDVWWSSKLAMWSGGR